MVQTYSLVECLSEYQKNKDKIQAHLTGKPIETYENDNGDSGKIMGLTIALFVILMAVNLVLLIIFFVIYIMNFKYLPQWAQIVAPILAVFFGPIGFIAGLVIILVTKSKSNRQK